MGAKGMVSNLVIPGRYEERIEIFEPGTQRFIHIKAWLPNLIHTNFMAIDKKVGP